MRVGAHFDLSEIERPHSEEQPLGRVSKDESPLSFQTATSRWGALQLLLNCCVESFTSSSVCAAEPFERRVGAGNKADIAQVSLERISHQGISHQDLEQT
jgi:hypothetical protein